MQPVGFVMYEYSKQIVACGVWQSFEFFVLFYFVFVSTEKTICWNYLSTFIYFLMLSHSNFKVVNSILWT